MPEFLVVSLSIYHQTRKTFGQNKKFKLKFITTMKRSFFYFLGIILILTACGQTESKSRPNATNMQTTTQTFYDFEMKTLDGKSTINFSDYEDKKVLLVNVASKCGFTSQYEDLQKFHEEYGDKVVVLGFPANNFGGQEPGTNTEIAEFCKKNYGVTFQMFEKISVKGDDQHPLYQWLSAQTQDPSWNFCKYLINEKGEVVKFYASSVNPFDEAILNEIE